MFFRLKGISWEISVYHVCFAGKWVFCAIGYCLIPYSLTKHPEPKRQELKKRILLFGFLEKRLLYCLLGGETLTRMVCALFSSTWQCLKTDGVLYGGSHTLWLIGLKKAHFFQLFFFNLVKKLRLSQGALPHWAEVSCHIVFPTPPLHCPSHPHLLSICNH